MQVKTTRTKQEPTNSEQKQINDKSTSVVTADQLTDQRRINDGSVTRSVSMADQLISCSFVVLAPTPMFRTTVLAPTASLSIVVRQSLWTELDTLF
jgi:hypothetical protein